MFPLNSTKIPAMRTLYAHVITIIFILEQQKKHGRDQESIYNFS